MKVSLGRDSRDSLLFFYKILGIKIFLVIALGVMGVISESFGVALFLPFIGDQLLGRTSELPEFFPIEYLPSFLNYDVSLLLLLLMGFLVKAICHFLTLFEVIKIRAFLYYYLRSAVIHRIISEIPLDRDETQGKLTNVLVDQVNRSVQGFNQAIQAILAAVFGVVYLGFAIYVDPRFATTVVVSGILMIGASWFLSTEIARLSYPHTNATTKVTTIGLDLIRALKYLRATSSLGLMSARLDERLNELRRIQTDIGKFQSLLQSLREPMVLVSLISGLWFYIYFFGGELVASLITIFLLYRALSSFSNSQAFLSGFAEFTGSIRVVKTTIQNVIVKNAEVITNCLAERAGCVRSVGIRVRGLDINRAESKQAIEASSVNIDIKPGELVGIIGESGSGKTTFVDFCSGVLPSAPGVISFYYLAETNERRLVNSDRLTIGYVTQSPVLFEGSVQDNLAFNNPYCSERELVSEVIKLGLADCVASASKFLGKRVIDGGKNLSGGQAQRIALAREICRKPNILFLDEFTSALDGEAQRNIMFRINSLIKETGVTVVAVMHRLELLQFVDHIYLLSSGRVVEGSTFGTATHDPQSPIGKLINAHGLQR